MLTRCCSLRSFDADVDPAAFSRLHARVTHSPSASPAAPPAQLQRKLHSSLNRAPPSALESPLRPEPLAHPMEVDVLSSGCTEGEGLQHSAAQLEPTASPPTSPCIRPQACSQPSSSGPPPPSSSSPSLLPSLHSPAQLPPAADGTGSSTPPHVDASSSMHISDITVECISPPRQRPVSSARVGDAAWSSASLPAAGSSRLRSTGTSYAEMSFKAAARPLRDSASAARQQVPAAPPQRSARGLMARTGAAEAEERTAAVRCRAHRYVGVRWLLLWLRAVRRPNVAPADEEMQKFMFDGNLPRHRQSTVSSTSKSAAAMLTAKVAQTRMEGWKQRLHQAQETARGEQAHHGDHETLPQQHADQAPDAPLTDAALASTSPPHNPRASPAAAVVHTAALSAAACDPAAGADAPSASTIRALAAAAADAAAGALASVAASTDAPAAPSSLDAVLPHSAPPPSLSAAPSHRVFTARQSPIIKLGAGGARTFSGTAPFASPLRIRLPNSSPMPSASSSSTAASQSQRSFFESSAPQPTLNPPSSSSSSPYVAIPFGSSLRRPHVSPSPGSKGERATRPSPSQPAASTASTSMDRIAAPTVASEMRAGKSPPQADAGAAVGGSRPVILGFRDAYATQTRSSGE